MSASKLLILPIILLALFTHHVYIEDGIMDISLETVGFMMVLIASLGRIWASSYIDGKKTKQLIDQGPFSITRNPLYFFSFLGFVGAGIAFESILLAALMTVVFFLLHWPTILAEEKNLLAVFGKEYERYMAEVPRFIPRSLNIKNAESIELYPKIFGRSMIECSLIACVFILAHLVEWCHIEGILPVFFLVP